MLFLLALVSLARAECNLAPSPGLTCDPSGTDPVCRWKNRQWTCDLNDFDSGTPTQGGSITFAYGPANTGAGDDACDGYCAWGVDGHGNDFCCETEDVLTSVLVYGTEHADTVNLADASGNRLDPNPSHPHSSEMFVNVQLSSGDDTCSGVEGALVVDVDGGDGNDTFDVGTGFVWENPSTDFDGGGGDDIAIGGIGEDHFNGNDGNDTLLGGPNADTLEGDDGDDTLEGEGGNDVLYGWAGDDILDGGAGVDGLYGGEDSDTLHGGSGDDFCDGNDGRDELYGDAGRDQLWGEAGDDRLFGGDGNDLLIGDASGMGAVRSGEDRLEGGSGNDVLCGGEKADKLFGNGGDDRLFGENGVDTADGGAGTDKCDVATDPGCESKLPATYTCPTYW